MLPLNIGLPKTPHGLSIDRCPKPCPSVIPNTHQPRQMFPLHPPCQDSNQDFRAQKGSGPLKIFYHFSSETLLGLLKI